MVRASCLTGLAAGILMLLAVPVHAGPIFVAGKLDGDKFTPAKEPGSGWYYERYSTTNATVGEKATRVQVEEIIDGPEKAVEAICVIPLADGAGGDGIRISINAPGSDKTVLAGTFLNATKAQAIYEAVARGTGSTKMLAHTGRPAILVSHVELQGKMQMNIEFQTPIHRTQGVEWISCPMPASSWNKAPVERLTLNVELKTKEPLRSVFSPTHIATIQRKGLNEATATVKADHWTGMDDFRLFWVADKDDLGLRALAFKGSEKEDGFFMLLGNPTGAAVERVVDKDVVLVLDTSGSMRGEKIEQARSALDYCLEHLNKGDRFNIITFGSEVSSFRDEPVKLEPATLSAAREFVENVVANGMTNISGALEKALAGKTESGRERIMIFLTDGAPTVGERSPEKILDAVKKQNTNGTKVFVMGVGNDVNAHLLDQLAEITDGSSEYVAPREELDAKVAALYDRLSHPVLSSVKVSFGEAGAKSVLPSKVPVLFKGSEIMMVGRYTEGGKHTFTISGNLAGKEVKYQCTVDLPAKTGDSTNEFLAPLWAARQIGYLLQEIRLHGGKQELIEEVVRLSKQYGIVTEYTADVVAMGGGAGGMAGPDAVAAMAKAAGKKLDMARGEKAGQWAVNQAANDKALQGRACAAPEANVYRDRRGNLQVVRTVTQIGRRAFYLQDGQWIDADDAGTRKTRVVKYMSPEHLELLKDPTFAKAQQLSWAISMNIGDERIVIEKDGKQKDDSLKSQQPQGDDEPLPGKGERGGKGLEQQPPNLPKFPDRGKQDLPEKRIEQEKR
jgi:Ca-activated chloride channel family protein